MGSAIREAAGVLIRRTSRGGLGTLYKTDPSTGTVIDCDNWNNMFQSVCWNPFSPSVVPVAPSVVGGDASSDGSDGGLVAAVAAVPALQSTSSTWLWIAAAVIGGLLVMEMVRR